MPHKTFSTFLANLFFLAFIFSSCTIPRKVPENKPFIFRNTIDVNGGDFSKDQRNSLKQKLFSQLDDSAKTNIKDFLFFFHFIKNPPVYDSGYAEVSARNIRSSLLHLGYYGAKVSYEADTIRAGKQERVHVKYAVEAGNPTIIDTISYRLQKPELQELALETQDKALLAKGNPITKANVLGDISRLVELYRNNGYYKFSSDDLKLRGDTTIAALTTISDDPFENLQLLEEATQQREQPKIKLAMILNPVGDSLRLKKYYINKIYIYPDYLAEDATNSAPYTQDTTRSGNYIIRYHKKLFKNSLLVRNMTIKPGDIYRLDEYNKTLGNFSKTTAWQNANIQIVENKDSIGKIDMIVQLLPAKKYGFEANIEASYSANSNLNNPSIANAGNLLGLSTNVSLQNRNVGKSGTKMTHALRAGIELNLNSKQQSGRKLNSTEFSYTNTISFPRLIGPIRYITQNKRTVSQQTFINIVPAYTNRINLFNQLSASVAFGNEWSLRPNRKNIVKIPNIEYSYLYNQSDSFRKTLERNPYLRYSFNTALVVGTSYGYTSTFVNAKHPGRQRTFRWNIEESGLLLGRLNVFNEQLRQFIKTDFEYTYVVAATKSASIFRAFAGVGVPVGKRDSSLPFFKQYFAGGPNSMRAWPIRGIGPGSKALAPYNSLALNDRTGDVRLELNGEYRYDIAQLIPNSLVLKGAFFIDAGNVWNFRNTNTNGGEDTLQFRFKNLYKQLGVSAGTGFRLDFNYFLIRFDLGFRFKRPDIAENYGWKFPNITFSNLFRRGEEIADPANPGKTVNDERYRRWRYENFNFTIGLSYPF
ncbi:MAG: BamA/TamA family outer membrane protein [Ferruginibacter sp.]|nr:BamA/TamA family outer membrane protein [Ferruginibacter sp.]